MNLIKWEKTFKEANEKEAKYFKVNKEYATRYIIPITAKFYARHEAVDFSRADPKILRSVTTYLDKGPKDKYDWPVTENQMYLNYL